MPPLECGLMAAFNGMPIIALRWLILNREKLPDIFGPNRKSSGI